jgi:hypothetical protein
VIIILGPAAPEEISITDANNRVWITPDECLSENVPVLNQFDPIAAELTDYLQAGGNIIARFSVSTKE